MARSPFAKRHFIGYFACGWVLLAVLYAVAIKNLTGYSWTYAIQESSWTWVLLLPGAIFCLFIPRFYLPAVPWYIYLPVIGGVLAYGSAWLSFSLATYFSVSHIIDLTDPLFTMRWLVGFMVLTGLFGMGILWNRSGEKEDAGKRQAEINEKMRDAELHKLQHQLQPHFLFNSLNSINALIQVEPEQARDMVQKLSDFLRFTLKRADEQWVNLEHEMEYLNLYLDIEKIRFRHRLHLTVELQDEALAQRIPTLILQPIVENAIKFGLYGTTGKVSISLKAEVKNNLIQVVVINPFDTDMLPSSGGTGFGLKAIRRRLQLLYNRNDLLQTSHHENVYTTILNIPIHKQ